jgi:prefoldin subunit 5
MDWTAIGSAVAVLALVYTMLRNFKSDISIEIREVAKRIESVDKRIDSLDKRIDSLEGKICILDNRILLLDQRVSRIEGYLSGKADESVIALKLFLDKQGK